MVTRLTAWTMFNRMIFIQLNAHSHSKRKHSSGIRKVHEYIDACSNRGQSRCLLPDFLIFTVDQHVVDSNIKDSKTGNSCQILLKFMKSSEEATNQIVHRKLKK